MPSPPTLAAARARPANAEGNPRSAAADAIRTRAAARRTPVLAAARARLSGRLVAQDDDRRERQVARREAVAAVARRHGDADVGCAEAHARADLELPDAALFAGGVAIREASPLPRPA